MKEQGGIEYWPALDGIRAIAILAILVFHYWPVDFGILTGGFIGVEIFFVISGFLITFLLLREWQKYGQIKLAGFWRKRARRLVPAFVAMILLVVLFSAVMPEMQSRIKDSQLPAIAELIPDMDGEAYSLKSQALFGIIYATNWHLIFRGSSYFEQTNRPPLLEHLWSLAIEGQFYLFWPIFLVFLLKTLKRKPAWHFIIFIAMAAFSAYRMVYLGQNSVQVSRAYFGTDARIYALVLGGILALFKTSEKLKTRYLTARFYNFAGVIAVTVLILFSFLLDGNGKYLYTGGLFAVSLAAILLIASVIENKNGFCARLLKLQPLVWIGQRSYSLYLWHWPIFVLTEPAYNYPHNDYGLLAIRVLSLLITTELSYRFIEKPIRKGLIGEFYMKLKKAEGRYKKKLTLQGTAILATVFLLLIFCSKTVFTAQETRLPIPCQADEVVSAKDDEKMNTETAAESLAEFKNESSETGSQVKQKSKILAIGDSVMLGARQAMINVFEGDIMVDARVSRQFDEVYGIVNKLKKINALPEYIIIHTGTNGTIEESKFVEMMDILSDCRRVVIINLRVPRKWQDANNKIISRTVARYVNAVFIDWQSLSEKCREVFYKDGIHLKQQGANLYAKLAKSALLP